MLKSKYLVSELFCGSFPGCLRVYFLYTLFDFIKSLLFFFFFNDNFNNFSKEGSFGFTSR